MALDPDSPSIKRAYAVIYLGTGKPEQADRVILDVIERRPFDDEPHRMRAEILGRQGRTEEARNELRRAIELRPANVANYLSLGNSHFYAGRYGDAIQSYIQGLEIQPDNVWLKSNLAAAYSYNGEPRKAIAVYESVADLDATMLSNLSTLYFDEERYQEAADSAGAGAGARAPVRDQAWQPRRHVPAAGAHEGRRGGVPESGRSDRGTA